LAALVALLLAEIRTPTDLLAWIREAPALQVVQVVMARSLELVVLGVLLAAVAPVITSVAEVVVVVLEPRVLALVVKQSLHTLKGD
jgi:hypothetical protein